MLALASILLAQIRPGVLEGIIPHPTGQNGYEEYLQAAVLLQSPEAVVYASWAPGAEARSSADRDPATTKRVMDLYAHLDGMAPLEVRREELRRFGRALDLIRAGNGKPVVDPHLGPNLGPDTLFPEYAGFRAIARFAARAATVYAADGQTDRATDVLTDQLQFADNFSRSVLIANLVAASTISMTLVAFGDLLPRMSRIDAVRVEREVGSILARPVAARAVLPAELAFAKAGLRKAAESGQSTGLFYDPDDEKASARAKAMAREFDAMSRAERAGLMRGIESRLDSRAVEMDRILAGPEGKWASDIAALEAGESPVDLESTFVGMLTPLYSGYAGAAAVTRTRLRLLALHARLVRDRWDFGHDPESLDVPDPLTGASYLYERRPDGTIRLASRGLPSTGEIELKYKRPPVPEETGAKP